MSVVLCAVADRQTRELRRALEVLHGAPCPLLELDPDSEQPFSLAHGWIDAAGASAGDTVFVHGFDYQDPILPRPEPECDWSVWQYHHLCDQQRFSAVYSLLSELERRGAEVVNPPARQLDAFMKWHGLESLREAGLAVPELLLTNEAEAAEAFATGGPLVWRPVTGRGAWQRFEAKQRQALVALDQPPVLLARVVEGALIRAYLYDGRPLLAIAVAAPWAGPPERLEAVWPHPLDGEVAAQLAQAMSHLGLRWGQLGFVIHDGRPCIYDFDPDPRYEWLPPGYRERLNRNLALALSGKEPEGFQELDPSERETLFTRRMLRLPFEMEYSKYHDL